MWTPYLSIALIFRITTAELSLRSMALQDEYNDTQTVSCVKSIIENYYDCSFLTYVEFRSKDTNILSHIHARGSMTVLNRTPYFKNPLSNKGYLIYTRSAEDFVKKFKYLIAEKTWMPYARFLIVVQVLDVTALRDIFQELLKAHVKDVIVLDGSTTDSYTYDPFENNGCGKRFDRIIKLGKCSAEMPPGRFTNAARNGLRNCTLKLAATHWPPYAINPSKSIVKAKGVDEYLFTLLAEHGQFKVNISYVDDIADLVSVVDDNMVADGPLRWIQTNKYDAMTGGFTLVVNRASAFTYLYGHTSYNDEFRIIVRQAGIIHGWRILFLVFSPLVWLLLLLAFITVSVLIICLTRPKDKCFVMLSLFDNMLQHSCRIRRTRKARFILLIWIIFSTLIANFYQSGMFSWAAKPKLNYQIHKISDLDDFKLQPCISSAMRVFQNIVSAFDVLDINDYERKDPKCDTMSQSLRTVSNSNNMYTALPYSLYYSDRYQYYDKNGKSRLYSFQQPLSKIIYASFLSKGFPLYDRFHLLSMRVREAGLVQRLWDEYEYAQKKYYNVTKHTTCPHFDLSMSVIYFGWIASTLCFIGEILTNKYKQRRVLNTEQ